MVKIILKRFLLLIVLSLCACSKRTEKVGSFISDREISSIIRGVTTKNDIYARFGPPTIDDEGFLYLGILSETGPLTRRRAAKCYITYFKFDDDDLVSDIAQYEKDKLYTYKVSQYVTDMKSRGDKTFSNFIAGIVHDKSKLKSKRVAKTSPSTIR
ncbi:hypothetical protein Cyrtocomes_00543 [Candidatus Cyrtobacter comes]|uniref:Lipoprotein SmpA/OmlA domain-containing protein n=1 Tax=Candidatus Cyrtobacter comes TaxID=675776 RepID=A0ABU5L802_9RICK|nr:hypothetical protein [Candidatus Cyrtobacter comes]MDZ5762172.1 hypothetical protein [Candidatus Cyrtobacter comes]